MNIFPIGAAQAANSQGSMNSVTTWPFFEPNLRCSSNKIYTVLTSRFENQTLQSRKKAEPYLMINYEYENIFAREFHQIETFIDLVEEGLNSFYVVDFSRGQTPTGVTDSSGDWVVAIDFTNYYSTTANQKATRAFLTDGINWKEGPVDSMSANTSITVDVDGSNYGSLLLATANTSAVVFPLYEVYLVPNSMSDFKAGTFVGGKMTLTKDGGFIRSGSISFTTKYKV